MSEVTTKVLATHSGGIEDRSNVLSMDSMAARTFGECVRMAIPVMDNGHAYFSDLWWFATWLKDRFDHLAVMEAATGEDWVEFHFWIGVREFGFDFLHVLDPETVDVFRGYADRSWFACVRRDRDKYTEETSITFKADKV